MVSCIEHAGTSDAALFAVDEIPGRASVVCRMLMRLGCVKGDSAGSDASAQQALFNSRRCVFSWYYFPLLAFHHRPRLKAYREVSSKF
jgi:hypothetical protein